ncbi:hypothetical protein AB4144_06220, partial [Rhizobiaceae sp. 2RAB30]
HRTSKWAKSSHNALYDFHTCRVDRLVVKDVAMQRARTNRTRATDFLSAFFLCVAAMLAGGYGPFSDEVRPTASTSAPGSRGADSADPQSSPTTPRRPFIAAEWRITKAALAQGEGSSKAALAPAVPSLPDAAPSTAHEALARRALLPASFHDYGARAPPSSHDQA